jgi:dCMP deaminase
MSDFRKQLKLEIFMDVALTIGDLGTCDRKKVGAVIVRDGRCISWGFNGAPEGLPHCSENNHGWAGWYEMHDTGKRTRGQLLAEIESRGCRNATHAEANALAFAARQGISTDGAELFVVCHRARMRSPHNRRRNCPRVLLRGIQEG